MAEHAGITEAQVDEVILDLAQQLQSIDGIVAVVLGGSRARGAHAPDSDVDLGLYYRPDAPPDLAALERLAASVDDRRSMGMITRIGEWGPWINGGGWLRVRGIPIDFLYRDLTRVTSVVEDCRAGRIQIDYQPGHPHGFASHIYAGEAALCRPLWDPERAIAELKERVIPYPPLLKEAIIAKFNWEAGFAIQTGRKSIARGDVAYAAGSCFRATACLMQVLFAINEQYWMNEKSSVALAATFVRTPERLRERVDRAFAGLAAAPGALAEAFEILSEIGLETSNLIDAQGG